MRDGRYWVGPGEIDVDVTELVPFAATMEGLQRGGTSALPLTAVTLGSTRKHAQM
jgi:hypothetical protein